MCKVSAVTMMHEYIVASFLLSLHIARSSINVAIHLLSSAWRQLSCLAFSPLSTSLRSLGKCKGTVITPLVCTSLWKTSTAKLRTRGLFAQGRWCHRPPQLPSPHFLGHYIQWWHSPDIHSCQPILPFTCKTSFSLMLWPQTQNNHAMFQWNGPTIT